MKQHINTVIEYWFSDRVRKKWWAKNAAFDAEIFDEFSDLHKKATNGDLAHWRQTALGRLAEIIVLDQFSRNMFRDRARAFAQDDMARRLTHEAVKQQADLLLTAEQRAFLYMPLMHSESAPDHAEAVRLYSSHPDLKTNLEFELKHKAIIDRFGRYPHRNEVLGRESSEQEKAFLRRPGSSF